MASIACRVEAIEPVRHAAIPTLAFRLQLSQPPEQPPIASIALQCQLRVDCARREYSMDESERLRDLFGAPGDAPRVPQSLLWTHAAVNVPAFDERSEVVLPVPCSFDFNVAATRYFAAIESRDVPLALHFSGTVFYTGDDGRLQIDRLPWSLEARTALPVATWRSMMDHYYPNTVWLPTPRPAFERLEQCRRALGLATWEQALERLLDAHVAEAAS